MSFVHSSTDVCPDIAVIDRESKSMVIAEIAVPFNTFLPVEEYLVAPYRSVSLPLYPYFFLKLLHHLIEQYTIAVAHVFTFVFVCLYIHAYFQNYVF